MQLYLHFIIELECNFNRLNISKVSLRSNKISQQGVPKDYISKVDSKLYLDIFIAPIQWGENVNLLFWERDLMAYVVELLMERYFADIHSSALSIWGYFPNIWLYYNTMPGAHFNTIKQDCRKILKKIWAIIIDGEGFDVIMAKNWGGLKAHSAPLCSVGPDYRSSCPWGNSADWLASCQWGRRIDLLHSDFQNQEGLRNSKNIR